MEIVTHQGTVRFPTLETWVYADVKGWTASDLIDEAGHSRLLAEAERELRAYVLPDGSVSFQTPGHIVIAAKPGGGA